MILLAHPFGNTNVRALLAALPEAGLLAKFITTLRWSKDSRLASLAPGRLRRTLAQRSYDLPVAKVEAHPARETVRLLAVSLGLTMLVEHERGWASIDQIWQDLDQHAACYLQHCQHPGHIRAVYAYEDCALQLFHAAEKIGVRRVYDLPITYWELTRRLLHEEAERYPEWEPTLGSTRDSHEKLTRKTRELELAELGFLSLHG